MTHSAKMQETLAHISKCCGLFVPEIAIILGSGLGDIKKHLKELVSIPYAELAVFPQQKVAGHHAELRIGELFGRKVLLFCGRFHVYQGLSCYDSTLPVQLAAKLGCHSVVLTCAVGGICEDIQPGDFLLVKDHLNFTGINPLQGVEPPVFTDLHSCYRYDFFEQLRSVAHQSHRVLHSGVLAYMTGPSYETPAEIVALRMLGASAVSMSTVPEAIMARSMNVEVVALALVTNMAGGRDNAKLSHSDVLACSAGAAEPFRSLMKSLLSESSLA